VIKSPNVISFFGLMFITDMMTLKRFGFYGVKPYPAARANAWRFSCRADVSHP
jgi:hypothetical protein